MKNVKTLDSKIPISISIIISKVLVFILFVSSVYHTDITLLWTIWF